MICTVREVPGLYAVCRLPARAPLPDWATNGDLLAAVWTPEELSVVCPQAGVPEGVVAERDWCVLQVAGPLDFAMTGVVAGLTTPLAEAKISVFVVSTFGTDYILVRAALLNQACAVLEKAGHVVE